VFKVLAKRDFKVSKKATAKARHYLIIVSVDKDQAKEQKEEMQSQRDKEGKIE